MADPLVVWSGRVSARYSLRHLPEDTYSVPVDVPYVPQFASPPLIHAYIHEGFHGRDDPEWQYTNNAYEQYATVGRDLLKSFGFEV